MDATRAEPMPAVAAHGAALTPAWVRYGRWIAAIVAVGFAVSIALTALDTLNVTAPALNLPESMRLPDRIEAVLVNQSQRFPFVFIGALLGAAAFAAFAALGAVLARFLGRDDPRATVFGASFLVAGIVGVMGQLAYIGMLAVATDPSYCQCDFADPQLIARGQLLDVTSSVQSWSVWGALAVIAVGLWAVGSLARERAFVPRGWATLSAWLGALTLIVAIVGAAFPPLASAQHWNVDPGLVTGLPSLIVLLVLVPWWALWLRSILAAQSASG
jgi:hypothetical protein